MVAEESSCNGSGEKVPPNRQEANQLPVRSGSFGVSGSGGILTFKRRKLSKATVSVSKSEDNEKGSIEAAGQLVDQTVCEPGKNISRCNSSFSNKDCNTAAKGLQFCQIRDWRNIVLNQICDTFDESDSCLLGCIRDAIVCHPGVDVVAKSFLNCPEVIQRCSEENQGIPGSSQVEGHPSLMPNGVLDEASRQTMTKMCQRALSSILISEKFSSLCKLLVENFQGVKITNLFDLTLINSRMKEGVYERSPLLFASDVREVWGKLERISSELLSLANSLSNLSVKSCNEQIQGLGVGTFEAGAQEDSDSHAKLEAMVPCNVHEVATCKHCGHRADGKDSLICDSCEEMYHVSCVGLSVESSSLRNWYCANCAIKGMGSSHEQCFVCRTKKIRSSVNQAGEDLVPTLGINEREESSGYLVEEDDSSPLEGESVCKVCRSQVHGEEFKVCSHEFCFSKYYHVRCLTSKQLKPHGPRWYCPSCLCSVCLTDRDDDKVVLCDGCSHAYHTYCMDPPHSAIPKGNWFCENCTTEIQRIRKGKMQRLNLEKWSSGSEEKKQVPNAEKGDYCDKGGRGVNMLLDAAMKLNYDEEVAASGP